MGRRAAIALAAVLALLGWWPIPRAAAQSGSVGPHAGVAAITTGEVRETIAVLADDSLEGREAGTAGAERAARYIGERFGAIGLEAPEGGYFQTFELPAGVGAGAESRLSFAAVGGRTVESRGAFEAPADFVPLPFSAEGAAEGPLVVRASGPERLDAPGGAPPIRGAVVLLAGADASVNPATIRDRVEELAEAGAAAALVLSDPASLTFSGRAAGLEPVSIPALVLGLTAAERLAGAAGIDLLALAHGAAPDVRVPTRVSLRADLSQPRTSTSNVIGVLKGTDSELREQAVVVGAHYDHLGWGGPGSLAPGERAIHNGADDNASGVAGILELADWFAAHRPRRSLVFAAWGAEEAGNLGSGYYVKSPAWPLERTIAMVNLDMVGRLRGQLQVYGTGTSPSWPVLLDSLEAGDRRGAAPLDLRRVPDGFGPSDHASFYGAGIPVLAFFTGAHRDYHRPSDDLATINAEGEVRVLELARRVIEAVADSDRRIPFSDAPVTKRPAPAFKVALGTLPDYGFEGPGVRLSSLRPGGPAARAGLRAGDVLMRLDGREVTDVYAYTAILADLEAGQPVELVYERDGRRQTVAVTPEAR